MQVQRKKPDTDSSLDAGSKDVTPIVVAMLWSNHCDHLQSSTTNLHDRKDRTEKTQNIFSSTSVPNNGWMQQ